MKNTKKVVAVFHLLDSGDRQPLEELELLIVDPFMNLAGIADVGRIIAISINPSPSPKKPFLKKNWA